MRRSLVLLALVACSKKNDDAGRAPVALEAGPSPDASATATSCIDRLPAALVVDPVKAAELVVASDPPAPMGIFDPSLVYPAGAAAGALAYSAVKAKDDIETRIALSSDEGATWTYVVSANATVAAPGGVGNFIHEVSSLVVDPTDPDAARRWKLFSHRYLAKGTDLHYDVGNIALQTAPAAEGPWSPPTANVGWKGSSSFSSDGAAFVAADAPTTSDCLAFTEPSAVTLPNGVLALTLGCATGSSIRVVLLLSTDHSASWTAVGTLVPASDAGCLGRTAGLARVNAASLFGEGGKAYVWITPESATGYHGCAAVEVTDLAKLTLARAPDGAPLVTRLLSTPSDQFSGACTSAEGATKSSTLMSIAFLGDARPFRIFRP